jgi:hypothetical protein
MSNQRYTVIKPSAMKQMGMIGEENIDEDDEVNNMMEEGNDVDEDEDDEFGPPIENENSDGGELTKVNRRSTAAQRMARPSSIVHVNTGALEVYFNSQIIYYNKHMILWDI